MRRIPRFQQRSLHTLQRRVGSRIRRWWLRRFVPSPKVRVVQFGGQRYKRITFPDTWMAERQAQHLECFRRFGTFPQLVARFENELLVEFIDGRVLEAFDVPLIGPLARFFGTLYGPEARRVGLEEAGHGAALQRDLAFLLDAGVLEARIHGELATLAERIAPSHVWLGYEYIDSLPKNFVRTPGGRLVAVDVAALHPDHLLGIGVAKALLRSPDSHRELFLREMKERSSIDFSGSMPFVELCFLASWTKMLFLKGRARLIDPAHFDPVRFKTG